MPYSLLDLSPIPQGFEAGDALRNTLELARNAERWGYKRYWLAEHHNSAGIASAATSVLIGHVAGGTSSIRVGAGGIMLPNHAPLVIAEQFGTLATLYPDRIDLGLGRAPGTDMTTARALRRGKDAESFPSDVVELLGYLGEPDPDAKVRAIPGAGTNVPIWILGSSLFGAQLAAHIGLPYAFASHFAPAALEQAAEIYRRTFRPSQFRDKPHFMMAINVFGAPTDAEGHFIRTSMQLGFARLRTGMPGKLPPPTDDIDAKISREIRPMVDEALQVTAVGSPQSVKSQLADYIQVYQPDEVILTGHIHDHQARLQSFRIGAEAMEALAEEKTSSVHPPRR
ncbi:LLM class flavin-dependent oxidoreductase [Oricola cellulosilytica]|uniref:Luciferase-like monooxygenase n=1 Tax=Oricola cellulosilytica TaxID=1429082 RepID=A0A4R0PFN8_9HYPH|nr:LLM class flavin-dependent oxidoreductase [Oricola cellulosilytica]